MDLSPSKVDINIFGYQNIVNALPRMLGDNSQSNVQLVHMKYLQPVNNSNHI